MWWNKIKKLSEKHYNCSNVWSLRKHLESRVLYFEFHTFFFDSIGEELLRALPRCTASTRSQTHLLFIECVFCCRGIIKAQKQLFWTSANIRTDLWKQRGVWEAFTRTLLPTHRTNCETCDWLNLLLSQGRGAASQLVFDFTERW